MPDSGYSALERELADTVDGEVRFDIGSRALYATDGSNYRQVPIGVVIPRTIDAVIATVAACRRHGAPVLPRGGGTSLCGQCCNTAVVMDFSKYMNRIVDIDWEARRARVQPLRRYRSRLLLAWTSRRSIDHFNIVGSSASPVIRGRELKGDSAIQKRHGWAAHSPA